MATNNIAHEHTLFTDGKKYANVFVRELFISDDIYELLGANPSLKFFQVRDSQHSQGALVTIVDADSYNPSLDMYENYFLTSDYQPDIVVLRGKGAFSGKYCYAVLDWETGWSQCEADNMVSNHEIVFNAAINRYVATHIKFSPTIAAYIESACPVSDSVALPDSGFDREVFKMADGAYVSFEVSSASDLQAKITANSKVIISLSSDIRLSSSIVVGSGKNVVIRGNGHRIFEYHDPITSLQVSNGRRTAAFSGTFDQSIAFNTPEGEMLLLEKSGMYRSSQWGGAYPSLTREFVVDGNVVPANETVPDNVFLSYSLWYRRLSSKLSSWQHASGASHLLFPIQYGGDVDFFTTGQNNYTSKPYFFLSNVEGQGDGVLIKDGKVLFPVCYESIARCTIDTLIHVVEAGSLELNDVIISGGTSNTINNRGNLRLAGCIISNKSGNGIVSYGKLFVSRCQFKDILGSGILGYFDVSKITQQEYSPYTEVTESSFLQIGTYGTNVFAIENRTRGYIGHNKFVDTNYGAVSIGSLRGLSSSETQDVEAGLVVMKEACDNMVEHNVVSYTSEWVERRKMLGLQDSGAIYVATNNKNAVVHHNKIVGYGGAYHEEGGSHQAIFCDDGAYNVSVYCNIITHTDASDGKNFDISARDYQGSRVKPAGETYCTNNYICWNVCDGWLKIQEHGSTQSGSMSETGCTFEGNIMIHPYGCLHAIDKNIVNSSYHPYNHGNPIVYDNKGFIDAEGNIFSATDYYKKLGIISYPL